MRLVEKAEEYNIDAGLDGGGVSGQAGALRLGIARALAELEPDLRVPLKRAGFLTRDPREKEQKKYGLKKARKAPAVLQALVARHSRRQCPGRNVSHKIDAAFRH